MANRITEPRYTPTREEIERECERIRAEREKYRGRPSTESGEEYVWQKTVYRHHKSSGRRLLKPL